jgi:ribonuclease-3
VNLRVYAENEWSMDKKSFSADLADLQKSLGVTFNNSALLEQALVHSSYSNENPGADIASNERLEFLGDAILGMVIAEKLYQDYPDFTEGKMTKLRAALVRRETLADLAESIELGNYLDLGRGEELSGGRHKQANLACTLEAVIAAVFLDCDMDGTREFILRFFHNELEKAVSRSTVADYKSELQELIQSSEQQPPSYHLVGEAGPDHGKTFTVEVRLGRIVLGKGSGKSKKAAETEAARQALEKLPAIFTR